MPPKKPTRPTQQRGASAFTLVELLITVTILLILASVVIPAFVNSNEKARQSQLAYNLKSIRNAIEIYTLEHEGRFPAIKADGSLDDNSTRFTLRLSDRSWKSGGVGAAGPLGPYISPWPSNPFAEDDDNDAKIRIDTLAPGSGNRGWHFNTDTGTFSANTPEHVNY